MFILGKISHPNIILKSIKAFSLVEGIVTITIITLMMALAFGVLANILNDRKQELVVIANLHIDHMLQEVEQEKAFEDITTDLGFMKIDQVCEIHPGTERAMIVTYEIRTRAQKKIYERKHIVQIKD